MGLYMSAILFSTPYAGLVWMQRPDMAIPNYSAIFNNNSTRQDLRVLGLLHDQVGKYLEVYPCQSHYCNAVFDDCIDGTTGATATSIAYKHQENVSAVQLYTAAELHLLYADSRMLGRCHRHRRRCLL